MEGISTRCSFHALLAGLVGLRIAVEGMGIVAAGAMIPVAEVSTVHEALNPILVKLPGLALRRPCLLYRV